MLHLGVDTRQVLDRPHHEGQVGDEGMDAADGEAADVALHPAVPDDGTQGKGGDDLHGRQEERRKPGGPVGGLVHVAGQDWNSFRFSSSRPSALTTRTPWMFSLYAPVILELARRICGIPPGSSCGT